jgi:hypothetical protein
MQDTFWALAALTFGICLFFACAGLLAQGVQLCKERVENERLRKLLKPYAT